MYDNIKTQSVLKRYTWNFSPIICGGQKDGSLEKQMATTGEQLQNGDNIFQEQLVNKDCKKMNQESRVSQCNIYKKAQNGLLRLTCKGH